MKKHKINWTHWFQMRGVKVWEACLLSLDVDPSTIVKEFESAFYVRNSMTPQIINSLVPGAPIQKEYYRRLGLISGYLDDTGTFKPIAKTDPNKHLWEIRLSEFCALAMRIKLQPLPTEMCSTVAPVTPRASLTISPVANNTDQPTTQPAIDWTTISNEIGLRVQQEKPKFTRGQIAENVYAAMKKMHADGREGVTGRSGKIPSKAS